MLRVVRRYPNRKLYDTMGKRYVTLGEIQKWMRRGEQVKIVEHRSGEDVTVPSLLRGLAARPRNGVLTKLLNGHEIKNGPSRKEFEKLAQQVRRLTAKLDRFRRRG